jgi:hypothetical protein
MAMLTDNDFAAEIPTLSKPTGRAGGGAGVFDGKVSLGWRNPPHNSAGITGSKTFGARTTFGITMAMAFPVNLRQDTVAKSAWKFNEWAQNPNEAGGDGLFGFGHSSGWGSYFPFYGFITQRAPAHRSGAFTVAQCRTALASARSSTGGTPVGKFTCYDAGGISGLHWFPSNYSHLVDWPLGTWGCLRGYYQNMGTRNSAWKITFTGPARVEKTIIDIANMDTTGLKPGQTPNGYDRFIWNNYANANQAGAVPSTVLTFRYEDNVHIRAGAPVSCSQIGFNASSAGSDTVAPATPNALNLR